MVPVLEDPSRAWKPAAFSQYPRGEVMGHSMRTARYRYTEWAEPGKEPVGVELYDQEADPGETVNVAGDPARAALVAELHERLREGWRGALPEKNSP